MTVLIEDGRLRIDDVGMHYSVMLLLKRGMDGTV